MGMSISASGVLLRAAERLERTRDSNYLGFPLRELYGHLQELKRLHAEGKGAESLDAFFGTWTGLERPSGLDE